MDALDAMQAYVRVAELASFTAAADTLGLPKATVSAAVQQMESRLGARLLHRTTRKVQMTQDGRVAYERCRDLLADVDELQSLFRADAKQLAGRLRVDMPLGIARYVVLPRLPEFLAAHPGIEIELSSTDRRVDLVREGFDCVLRVGPLVDSSLIARPLGAYRQVNVVSSGYAQVHGVPQTLDELASHRLVHYVGVLGNRPLGFEICDASDPSGSRWWPMPGALTVNNSDAYLGACLAGLGIIQAPEHGMQPHIDTGHLLEVLPAHRAPSLPVTLLYANRRHLPRRVQAFMDWLGEQMAPLVERSQSVGRT